MAAGDRLTDAVRVRLDAETRAALERVAIRTERPVGAVIRLAIRDYLARNSHTTEGTTT